MQEHAGFIFPPVMIALAIQGYTKDRSEKSGNTREALFDAQKQTSTLLGYKEGDRTRNIADIAESLAEWQMTL